MIISAILDMVAVVVIKIYGVEFMREVFLTPEHSKWWLLSPGVTIYYDKINICQSDFEKAQKEADQSSYHHQLALHLDAFTSRDDFPEIEVIPDEQLNLTDNYQQRSEVLKNLLVRRATDESDPTLTPRDLVKLTIDAFQHWIDYNQGKVRYLRKDEGYRELLGGELLPSWEERKKSLVDIYNAPEQEVLARFTEDSDALSTFKRLLASSSRCIDLIDSGRQIYDPMLAEYLPAIQIIEGKRISATLIDVGGDVADFFEAFRIQMAKYTEILPVDLSLSEVGANISSYSDIRDSLDRLDQTIRSIKDDDLAYSLKDVRAEIGSLVQEAENVSRNVGYGFWVSGLIWTVASMLGSPKVAGRVEEAAVAAQFASKGVGRFAGAYSLITDRVILQQDSAVSATNFAQIDYEHFRKHYWDFGSKGS